MNCMKQEHGYTMIEMLLVLMLISLCAIVFSALANILVHLYQPTYEEDDIAIKQMQLILAQAEDIRLQQNALVFYYHNKETHIELYQDKLVKSDGFEVLMQGLDTVSFYQEGSCFMLAYQRDHNIDKVLLGCE